MRNKLNQMKGQAIPLYSYHMMRDYLITAITGEHQRPILYWAGKDLAQRIAPESEEDCLDLFLNLGWGRLHSIRQHKHVHVYQLTSPFFEDREVSTNDSTFALECGFLCQALSMIYDAQTEAFYHLQQKNNETRVVITVHLEKTQEALT